MQIAATHLLPLTLIRRTRLLPNAGIVLVHPGQKVNSAEIIAETHQTGQHSLIDVRRLLGIKRADEAERAVERKPGESIQQNDIIAQTKGLFARILRSPVNGRIVSTQAGRVLIESPGSTFKLKAGMAGRVVDVIPDFGATIETSGALLQGVWGNDRFDQGLLLIVSRSVDDELTAERMDVSMRGMVLVGGHCGQADVLLMAADMPLRGLILSSISAELLPLAASQSYPIVIIEGIGRMPFTNSAHKILTSNDRRDTCLKANLFHPYSGERPEVIIPLPASAGPADELSEIRAGKVVRITGYPSASRFGTIVQIRPGLSRLPSGINAASADIRLENGEVVVAPLANLDVLD